MKLFRSFVLAACAFVVTAPLLLLGAMAFFASPHVAVFSMSGLLLPPLFAEASKLCLEVALLVIMLVALMAIGGILFPRQRASPSRRSGALVFPCGARAPPS